MGSDDGDKNRAHSPFCVLRLSACCRFAVRSLAAAVLPDKRRDLNTASNRRATHSSLTGLILGALVSLGIFIVVLLRVLPPPELLLSPTFTKDQVHVPEQCRAAASRFFQCQEQPTKTLVLACHRRWCNSWGFCEPCEGLGDRMRFMLSQVNEAMATIASGGTDSKRGDSAPKKAVDAAKESTSDPCVRIQLDYPVQDVATLETAVYQDPAGWWGHLLRQRSYSLGKTFHKESRRGSASVIAASHNHLRWTRTSIESTGDLTIAHFSPGHYVPKDYDPCYFHLLFRPSPALQADIGRHVQALTQKSSNIHQITASSTDHETALTLPSIGIHLRTGDVTAFGIYQNDTRVKGGDLTSAWSKMLQCADELSRELFPTHSSDQIPYFVATDNSRLKEWIASGQHEGSGFEGSTGKKRFIYTTDVTPRSSWQAWEGDRDAWMELYLLSMQSGLVVNVRPSGYAGGAGRTSFFSALAQKAGFMSGHRVRECVLE
jgi:hypothetical protein